MVTKAVTLPASRVQLTEAALIQLRDAVEQDRKAGDERRLRRLDAPTRGEERSEQADWFRGFLGTSTTRLQD